LTDYLVICGRASARPMDAACATLESPLDSSIYIIAQLVCPAQRSLVQRFQLSPSFAHGSAFRARTPDNFRLAVLNRPISLNRISEVRSGVFLDSEQEYSPSVGLFTSGGAIAGPAE
jgi:hypothetical protein